MNKSPDRRDSVVENFTDSTFGWKVEHYLILLFICLLTYTAAIIIYAIKNDLSVSDALYDVFSNEESCKDIIKAGDVWVKDFRDLRDPFKQDAIYKYDIVDVKDGYVQYKMQHGLSTRSGKIEDFCKYAKKESSDGTILYYDGTNLKRFEPQDGTILVANDGRAEVVLNPNKSENSVITIPNESVSNVKYDGATLSWDSGRNEWEAVSTSSHWTTMATHQAITKDGKIFYSNCKDNETTYWNLDGFECLPPSKTYVYDHDTLTLKDNRASMDPIIGIEHIKVGKTELRDGPNGEFLIKGDVIVDGTITQKGQAMTIVAGGLSWMTWFTIILVVILTMKFVNNFNWRIVLWPIKKLFSFFKKEVKEVEKTWNSIEGD
jgi:hypothetical protein